MAPFRLNSKRFKRAPKAPRRLNRPDRDQYRDHANVLTIPAQDTGNRTGRSHQKHGFPSASPLQPGFGRPLRNTDLQNDLADLVEGERQEYSCLLIFLSSIFLSACGTGVRLVISDRKMTGRKINLC
jgi:hypothetical protein